MDIYAAILAGGRSKRMNSTISKVLHPLLGKPLVFFPLKVACSLRPAGIFVIVSPDTHQEVAARVREMFPDEPIEFVVQPEPRGTGDAVMQLAPYFKDKDVDLLVMPGDAPLLREDTAKLMYRFHKENDARITILTAEVPDPTGYGRIVRSHGDRVLMIVEEKDAFPEEKEIREINSGIYLFRTGDLFSFLPEIKPQNAQGEYYLTDVIEIVQRKRGGVLAFKIADWKETLGVNTRPQLIQAQKILKQRLVDRWIREGVSFIDPDLVYLEYDVVLEKDATIYPFVSLIGQTHVGRGATVGPGVKLVNARVPDGAVLGFESGGDHG